VGFAAAQDDATDKEYEMTQEWFAVCGVDDIPLREGRCVSFGEHRVAVFNLGGTIRAVQNTCPHKQGPLSDGMIVGESIVCPLHTRAFDLKTGAALKEGEGQLRVYPVKVIDGRVFVAFEGTHEEEESSTQVKVSSFYKITAIIRTAAWPSTLEALEQVGCLAYARHKVLGRGEQHGLRNQTQEWSKAVPFLPKTLVEVIVDRGLLEAVVSNLIGASQTGQPGDGKIFVTPLEEVTQTESETIEKEMA